MKQIVPFAFEIDDRIVRRESNALCSPFFIFFVDFFVSFVPSWLVLPTFAR